MTTPTSRPAFEDFLKRALEHAETRSAFEDAQMRSALVDRLVRLRRRLGLTQSQVASRMGVKQPTVSGFETEGSDPRLSTMQRYARSVDAILTWDLRPRNQALPPDSYVPQSYGVHTSVNQSAPSTRARSWRPRSDIRRSAPSFGSDAA